MTQRPVPAARYSRLLTQDDSPDSTHKAPADISPLVTLRPSLPTTLSFLLGILSTAIFLTIFKPPLSSTLCVTSYHHDTTFTPHPEYANLSIQYDALWQDLLPSNGGFLIPLDAGSGEGKKGITMFHQLHCLQLLRIGLQKVHHGAAGEAGGSVEMAKDMKGHSMHANDEHYLHCLDYLRQVRGGTFLTFLSSYLIYRIIMSLIWGEERKR